MAVLHFRLRSGHTEARLDRVCAVVEDECPLAQSISVVTFGRRLDGHTGLGFGHFISFHQFISSFHNVGVLGRCMYLKA